MRCWLVLLDCSALVLQEAEISGLHCNRWTSHHCLTCVNSSYCSWDVHFHQKSKLQEMYLNRHYYPSCFSKNHCFCLILSHPGSSPSLHCLRFTWSWSVLAFFPLSPNHPHQSLVSLEFSIRLCILVCFWPINYCLSSSNCLFFKLRGRCPSLRSRLL